VTSSPTSDIIRVGRGSLNSLQAEKFIKKIRIKYGVRIVYTDNAPFYNLACKWARIEHRIYGKELKNLIERFIQTIKDRIE
jgi:transposase-like protein